MAKVAKIASKQKRIDDIVLMLERGLERKEILQQLAKTCKVSARTIDDEIKDAKIELKKRNDEKEAIRLSVTSVEYAQVVKGQIISDTELEVILCKIATGNIEVEEFIKGVPFLRGVSPSEQIQAIDKLYKKRGTYAPIKNDLGDKVKIIITKKQ